MKLVACQVLKSIDSAHVLACAPSNAAADLLAERLLENLPCASSSLLRMYAYSREWISVPSTIRVTHANFLMMFFQISHELVKVSVDLYSALS